MVPLLCGVTGDLIRRFPFSFPVPGGLGRGAKPECASLRLDRASFLFFESEPIFFASPTPSFRPVVRSGLNGLCPL